MIEKFNLYELVKAIEHVTRSHPMVSDFCFERYRLNTTGDLDYPAVAMTLGSNNIEVGENVTTVTFNLLYADRLTDNRDNTLAVQSAGVDVITEIYNGLRRCYNMDSKEPLRFNIFNEQFADNVAGVLTAVVLDFPSNLGRCEWLAIDKPCDM